MSFKEIQKEKTAQIEQILKAYLPRVQGYQEVIMDAMSYSMLAGGKRLRPMLMQETYRMFGGTDRVIAGDISDVWRSGQGDRAVYGCH